MTGKEVAELIYRLEFLIGADDKLILRGVPFGDAPDDEKAQRQYLRGLLESALEMLERT